MTTTATNGAGSPAPVTHVQPGTSILSQVGAPTALDQVMLQTEIDRRRMDLAKDVAKTASKSGFYGDLRTEDAALAKILAGAELGIPAMAALRVVYFFDGKITLASQAMLALARQRAEGFVLEYVRSDDKACVVRCGARAVAPTEFSFTIEEAQRAGLTRKDNWTKYPGAMLRARAVAAAIRAVCPEVILGVMATEEIDSDQVEVSIGASGQVELSRRGENAGGAPLPRTTAVSAKAPELGVLARAEAVEAKLAGCKTPAEVKDLWTAEANAIFTELGGRGAPRADELSGRFNARKAEVARPKPAPASAAAAPAQSATAAPTQDAPTQEPAAAPAPASAQDAAAASTSAPADQYPEPGSDG